MLRPFVAKAACAWDEARAYFGAKGIVTGNPVRGGFVSAARSPHRAPFTLLVFGGSQGSRILNEAVVAALPLLPGTETLSVVHQTGDAMHASVAAAYAQAGRPADVVAFIDDMAARLVAADLVVCRSGATSCAELQVAGRAALLVPFERSADDHQRVNARAMQSAGAARMIEESELTGARLAAAIRDLLSDPERLLAMEQAARRMARPDAAARVADLLEGKAA
jgi:UDP-N-acetylglucosamine--N-acetylmuramyl-(pentapeptide) pyrophosphoryl-undecaprenol N-acetylglucosamine transferase